MLGRAEDARAEHRRQRQRNEAGDQDRHRDRHREFAEHAADDAAHQQHRDEHRDQREGDRENRERDLARALQRRVERLHAAFDVARDVLQHDDGVVDDEADRQRDRQQRDIVDRIAEHEHERAGADQRDRQRERRNQVAAGDFRNTKMTMTTSAIEMRERALDVADRLPDRHRAVVEHAHLDRGRQLRLVIGNLRLHAVDDVDGVGVGLPIDRQHDRAILAVPGGDLLVLDRIVDLGDFLQPHRRAVAPGDDEIVVFGRVVHLAGGVDGDVLPAPEQRADRRRGIGGGDRRC